MFSHVGQIQEKLCADSDFDLNNFSALKRKEKESDKIISCRLPPRAANLPWITFEGFYHLWIRYIKQNLREILAIKQNSNYFYILSSVANWRIYYYRGIYQNLLAARQSMTEQWFLANIRCVYFRAQTSLNSDSIFSL